MLSGKQYEKKIWNYIFFFVNHNFTTRIIIHILDEWTVIDIKARADKVFVGSLECTYFLCVKFYPYYR
jgi:hypothetical protein